MFHVRKRGNASVRNIRKFRNVFFFHQHREYVIVTLEDLDYFLVRSSVAHARLKAGNFASMHQKNWPPKKKKEKKEAF